MVAGAGLLAACDDGPRCRSGRFCVEIAFEGSLPRELGRGDPVRVTGVTAGQVRSVERAGRDSIVRVELGLRFLPVQSDADAKVRPRLFKRGDWFVDLETGRGDGEPVPLGGRIRGTPP